VKDQPQSPLETAVFWTEYVIRHNGAPHMKSAAVNMPWWQVHLIDVYAAIFTVLFASLYIKWKLIKWCCCRKRKSVASRKSEARRSKNGKTKKQ
jgi:glucuronosyltransferase